MSSECVDVVGIVTRSGLDFRSLGANGQILGKFWSVNTDKVPKVLGMVMPTGATLRHIALACLRGGDTAGVPVSAFRSASPPPGGAAGLRPGGTAGRRNGGRRLHPAPVRRGCASARNNA